MSILCNAKITPTTVIQEESCWRAAFPRTMNSTSQSALVLASKIPRNKFGMHHFLDDSSGQRIEGN